MTKTELIEAVVTASNGCLSIDGTVAANITKVLINKIIAEIQGDLFSLNQSCPGESPDYYERQAGKIRYAESFLDYLQELIHE